MSTATRKVLFTGGGLRALVVTTGNRPWVLGGHESVAGVGECPELLGASPVEAELVVALVPTCSGVWAVPGLPAAPVGEAGLGCVVGDVVCT